MSGDVTLRCPAPPGLSGAAALHVPSAWIYSAAVLAAGWLVLSSEATGKEDLRASLAWADQDDRSPELLIPIGYSPALDLIVRRAQDRRARGERVIMASLRGPWREPQGFAELMEAREHPRGIRPAVLIEAMAELAVSVRSISYGSPFSVSLNIGPLGDVVRPGMRALVDLPGYKERVRTRNQADAAQARADIEEARVREQRAIIEQQYLSSLVFVPGEDLAVAGLAAALEAGGAPHSSASELAPALANTLGVRGSLETAMALDAEVVDEPDAGPEDIWFAAP